MLTKKQYETFERDFITKHEEKATCVLTMRFDDKCNNGHNSFSMTADIYEADKSRIDINCLRCGCCHDDIAKAFPEFEHLLKWHLTSTDGPLHYVSNAMYHASNTDYNGLMKDEYASWHLEVFAKIHINGSYISVYRTNTIYANKQNNPNLRSSNAKEQKDLDKFRDNIIVDYETRKHYNEHSKSKGSIPDLEAARSCAIWPEADLEDFTEAKLKERLPALMLEFKNDMEKLGFTY